ncbi:helix-turn-helix domain-containing protein [Pseudonocardia cypriaca]|uniref:AraC family transcriptional regulator n=1 Tax=Pseudonocardia cypriaca TaxID=882449 RepID=A0A543GC28_9PSEU|nr:helix-turn-helix domain-containing protein [Pseudonocardia cypriaca]TQM43574.1 AraC family transcriptional regulator [Pseudonocardia cypriaca]
MPAATVVSSVSTAGVAMGDRLAYWEDYNADALVGLTCSTYQPDGLLARQRNLSLDAFRVADIAGNPHAIERAPRMVRSRPKDATFVSMMVEGDAFFYHSGGCLTLRPGDTVVYDTDQPYLFGFSSSMRQLLVDIPQQLFAERCGQVPASQGPVLVPGDDPGVSGVSARALRRMLLELVADPVAASNAVGEQVLDLVQTVRSGRGSSSSTAHLLSAKAFIAGHLGDPRLCADVVARAVGVTPRHLNRAFAAEETTVAQYIVARRLDRARADLTSAHLAHFRIADIAFRWGFSSQAHFSRLFRARFGCSPSQVRTTVGFA